MTETWKKLKSEYDSQSVLHIKENEKFDQLYQNLIKYSLEICPLKRGDIIEITHKDRLGLMDYLRKNNIDRSNIDYLSTSDVIPIKVQIDSIWVEILDDYCKYGLLLKGKDKFGLPSYYSDQKEYFYKEYLDNVNYKKL